MREWIVIVIISCCLFAWLRFRGQSLRQEQYEVTSKRYLKKHLVKVCPGLIEMNESARAVLIEKICLILPHVRLSCRGGLDKEKWMSLRLAIMMALFECDEERFEPIVAYPAEDGFITQDLEHPQKSCLVIFIQQKSDEMFLTSKEGLLPVSFRFLAEKMYTQYSREDMVYTARYFENMLLGKEQPHNQAAEDTISHFCPLLKR